MDADVPLKLAELQKDIQARITTVDNQMDRLKGFMEYIRTNMESATLKCFDENDLNVANEYLERLEQERDMLGKCLRGEAEPGMRSLTEMNTIVQTRRAALNALGKDILSKNDTFKNHFVRDVGIKMEQRLTESLRVLEEVAASIDEKTEGLHTSKTR